MRFSTGLLALLILASCTPAGDEVRVASEMQEIVLENGTVYPITAARTQFSDAEITFEAYAYNNEIPGPLLRVRQGSSITVPFTNNLAEPSTIHWHGLRHDIKDDGVPGVSQDPVQPGETFEYTLRFPDAGVFWYHPHVREDRQQDLGLAGVIIVEPSDEAWPHADREEVLVLDDLLLEDDAQPVAYDKEHANFALMGRFGNVLLINGERNPSFEAKTGERVRYYILNAANVRPFNLSFGVPMRIIGSDIGLAQEPVIAGSLTIHPAERYIVDVVYPEADEYVLRNVNPWVSYDLGTVLVTPGEGDVPIDQPLPQSDIATFETYLNRPADLDLRIDVDMGRMGGMMNDHQMGHMQSVMDVEWEDTMAMMNAHSSTADTRWFFEEVGTGKRNMEIMPSFAVGDIVKIRILNDANGDHPMQHPIHLHGQRFLVIAIDGERPEQLAWKDTVAIPTGSSADILVEMTNPGEWMLHCHIAEHLEAGLMMSIMVTDRMEENT